MAASRHVRWVGVRRLPRRCEVSCSQNYLSVEAVLNRAGADIDVGDAQRHLEGADVAVREGGDEGGVEGVSGGEGE